MKDGLDTLRDRIAQAKAERRNIVVTPGFLEQVVTELSAARSASTVAR